MMQDRSCEFVCLGTDQVGVGDMLRNRQVSAIFIPLGRRHLPFSFLLIPLFSLLPFCGFLQLVGAHGFLALCCHGISDLTSDVFIGHAAGCSFLSDGFVMLRLMSVRKR